LEDEFYDFIEIYGYVSLPEGIVFLGFMFDDDDDYWLVVWNHGFFFLTFHMGTSSSQLTKSYFSERLKPPSSFFFGW